MKINWNEVNIDVGSGSARAEIPGGYIFARTYNSSIVRYGFVLNGKRDESEAILSLAHVAKKRKKDWPDAIDILSEARECAETFFNAKMFLG